MMGVNYVPFTQNRLILRSYYPFAVTVLLVLFMCHDTTTVLAMDNSCVPAGGFKQKTHNFSLMKA